MASHGCGGNGAVVPRSSALSGTQENLIFISDDENEEESLNVNPIGFETGDCRICYQSEDALGTNPVIKVGCECQGDNSNGHEACLVKWFKDKLLTSLSLECELCKGRLGAHLNSILLAKSLPEDRLPGRKRVPFVLVLLQVPVEDLDRLHVPIDTPAFEELTIGTILAIEESLQMQKEKYDDREMKMTMDDGVDLVPDQARAAQLREQFVDMVRVIQGRDGEEELKAFFPRGGGVGGDMNLKIVVQGIESRGEILRVPVPTRPQALNVEELLEDLARLVDMIVPYDEDLFILPRCMIVDNVSTDPSALPSGRQFTYGCYQQLPLFGSPLSDFEVSTSDSEASMSQ